ncbi:LAMI_0B06854g1_1 [Lachancea mirantina]|uniref:LAMI_0B06854g1_1 n=1 Tax=Lachancea mirantina TaxID=1230905 RepID=A0A1G4IWZ5_9SACH|nr:LAMI_0B06854g1_1 [Lachancea mirantina]
MLHPRNTEVFFTLNNGVRMPALGLGTAAEPPKTLPPTKQAVKAAVKAGYRLIDTAWAYGTEPYIGEALKELFEEGVVKREDLFITTKVWPTHWDLVEKSLEESLKSLGVEYVDLLLQHWPVCFERVSDPNGVNGIARNPTSSDGKPLLNKKGDHKETWRQIESLYLKKDPRIRAVGVSNFPSEYLDDLLKTAKVVPAVNQVELHPQFSQLKLRETCKNHHIILESYSPMGANGAALTELSIVQELVKKYDASPGAVLISYHVRQGVVTVPLSQNPKNIAANVELVPLTQQDIDALNKNGEEHIVRYRDEQFAYPVPGFREGHERA